jgi:hypothetical protein
MDESTRDLAPVNITGSRSHIREISSGIVRVDSKVQKQIPMVLGEDYILKSSFLLPGVQTVGEVSFGYNIHGRRQDTGLSDDDFLKADLHVDI